MVHFLKSKHVIVSVSDRISISSLDTVYSREEWFEYFNYISLNSRPFHWKSNILGLLIFCCRIFVSKVKFWPEVCLRLLVCVWEWRPQKRKIISFSSPSVTHDSTQRTDKYFNNPTTRYLFSSPISAPASEVWSLIDVTILQIVSCL